MSADYNGTDKSRCSPCCWAGWASSREWSLLHWGAGQSMALGRGRAVLPQACPVLGSAPAGTGLCLYLLLKDWSRCYGIPGDVLNIPAWNVWNSSGGNLLRSVKSREKHKFVFSTDGLFSISKIISFVWRSPRELTVELWDFVPFIFSKWKFMVISKLRKGIEECWGQEMWSNWIEMQASPGWEITQRLVKILGKI